MKTEETNALIAEFMGEQFAPEYIQEGKSGFMIFKDGGYQYPIYHKSWDWLMPVVEKIEDLGYPVWLQSLKNGHMVITIWTKPEEIVTTHNARKNKISFVYNAVIDFINWYNQQSK